MTRNIHTLLAKRRQIAVIWDVDDVIAIRPDLTDDQAWDVLQAALKHHDAGVGINWEVLEFQAEILFGSEPEPVTTEEG
jgi:hypothetical protein